MIQPLIRGFCPICNKIIMNEKKSEYINGGSEFFVLFNDNSRASFGICEDCYNKLTQEQLDILIERQKLNWGQEIQATLNWYIKKAINLRIVKHARTKDGLTAEPSGT